MKSYRQLPESSVVGNWKTKFAESDTCFVSELFLISETFVKPVQNASLWASDYPKRGTNLRQNDTNSEVKQSDMRLQYEQFCETMGARKKQACRCSLLRSECYSLPPRRIIPSFMKGLYLAILELLGKAEFLWGASSSRANFPFAPLVPNTCV